MTAIAETARIVAGGGPYKGLEHYSEDDAALFFGREAETELIVANALASRLTLVYGESGVGKSSLLRAGAARSLRDDPELGVVVFADWLGDPVAALADELRAAAGLARPPAEPTLAETVAAVTERLDRDLVVILDQFEAYFIYHGHEDGAGTFAVEFPRVVGKPELRVSFLLSIREDALAGLDRFKGRVPRLFDNYLRVRHLDRQAARDAIVRPLEHVPGHGGASLPAAIEPALVEAVLDQVEAGKVALGRVGAGGVDGSSGESRIEAPYLQLVMTRIWDEEVAAGSTTLRLATLERLGGAERIVRTHLDTAMETLAPDDRDVAARVFRYLVTPSGTKIAHSVADLAEYGDAPAPAVDQLLERLAGGDVRIVRPVAAGTFEIYHDVLAAPILDWRERFLRAREEARRERRRRRRRWSAVVVALVVAGSVAVGTAFALRDQQQETQAAREQAEAAQAQVDDLTRAVAFYKALYTAHVGPVRSAEFSPDGRLVATGSTDGTVQAWDWRAAQRATPRPLFAEYENAQVLDASFSPDGRRIVSANGGRGAWVESVRTGKVVLRLPGRGARITSAAFSPDGTTILTSGAGPARFWSATTGRVVARIGQDVLAAELSADSRSLLALSRGGALTIFDSRTGRRGRTLATTGIANAAISPNGEWVAATGPDRAVTVSNRLGAVVSRLRPRDATFDLAFSPDGRLLVTTGSKVARLWAWRDGVRLVDLQGHSGVVRSAAFDPAGKLIATASDDRTARVWEVLGAELALSDASLEVRSPTLLRARVRVSNLGTSESPRTTLEARTPVPAPPSDVIRIQPAPTPPRRRAAPVITGKGRAVVPRLSGGENAVVTIDIPLAAGAAPSKETLLLVLDPANDVDELNELNDAVRVATAIPQARLGVETIGIDWIGARVVVTIDVTNAGARSRRGFVRTGVPGWPPVATLLQPLAPGPARRLQIVLDPPPGADPAGVVATVTLLLDGEAVASDRTAPLVVGR